MKATKGLQKEENWFDSVRMLRAVSAEVLQTLPSSVMGSSRSRNAEKRARANLFQKLPVKPWSWDPPPPPNKKAPLVLMNKSGSSCLEVGSSGSGNYTPEKRFSKCGPQTSST